jgi:molecular chaperone IbpA
MFHNLNNFPFDKIDRWGVGFDTISNTRKTLFDSVKTSIDTNFPPYNIRKVGDNKYVVEIAAAGYTLGEFDITVDKDVLRIACTPNKEHEKYYEQSFIYRGLTSKPWLRNFILSDGVEVKDATLLNGLLTVFLEHFVPQEDKPKKINISQPTAASNPQLLNEDSVI